MILSESDAKGRHEKVQGRTLHGDNLSLKTLGIYTIHSRVLRRYKLQTFGEE